MSINGWILYSPFKARIKQDSYENSRFLEAAKAHDIDLKIIYPEQLDLIVTKEGEKSIFLDGENIILPDFVLPRMGSHTSYFSLAVLRHLEKLGVHIINHPHSIDVVKDKLYTQQILATNNLPVPKTMLVKFPVNVDLVEKYLGFPVIVKTIHGSQGSGVYLSNNKSSFDDLMQLINSTNTNMNIILQEFIKNSFGRDLRVLVIGGRPIGCMERISKDGSFKANFSQGGSVKKYELNPEIEWLATESSKILGLDVAGIDLLFDGEHYRICEANSAPGFEGFEEATQMKVAEEIFNYIKIRFSLA
ncbi:ATP-grasp domain-containing protein [Inediibacterium massiliense]|uniref:ATP-grasp domain-containing protein n=1 Tax=Inediibacterium massiliense TaxID=1658111 RepID=UPI000A611824|nr:RimK family alpha-L-glutamate ligase [Inediibacterium massiliense]